MGHPKYLMENEDEALRLDVKIDERKITDQALWAGVKPGMRIADIGSGSGKITGLLKDLTGPSGTVVGIDGSKERIGYAEKHYGAPGIEFRCQDILASLEHLGEFDFVWVRFVLQYYRSNSFDIVRNISSILKPGGIMCLIDQDCNCLCHYGFPERLGRTIQTLMEVISSRFNFDPFVGRKLYAHLFDLEFRDIDVTLAPHNFIFGRLSNVDSFNWMKKLEIVGKNIAFDFGEYPNGYAEFRDEFKASFADPRRFFYTPLISCRGIKPADR